MFSSAVFFLTERHFHSRYHPKHSISVRFYALAFAPVSDGHFVERCYRTQLSSSFISTVGKVYSEVTCFHWTHNVRYKQADEDDVQCNVLCHVESRCCCLRCPCCHDNRLARVQSSVYHPSFVSERGQP